MNTHQNPLLKISDLPHRAAPFNQIKDDDFLPALDVAIAEAKKKIETIKTSKELPSFVNTIEALESSSERVDWISNLFYNLLSSETNDRLQALAQEIGPKLSEFSSDLSLDAELFARVQQVHEQRSVLGLDHEQKQLLENTYTDFVRNGALLKEAQKQRIREIDQELSKLGPKFSDHVLKATNSFEMILSQPEELEGLPDSVKEAAQAAAEAKGHQGKYLFNLQAPSYLPFMQNSKHRPSREKLYRAFAGRSFGGEFDNQAIVKKIVQLRHERAQILGYSSHAHFVLEKRMAENPSRVEAFLDKLIKASKPAAEKDIDDLKKFAKETDGLDDLKPWDVTYYSERLMEARFSFNEEELRPYFQLEKVVEGVFTVAQKLYRLQFKPRSDLPVYHPDVKVYEVFQDNNNTLEFMGLLYTDYFPRESKRGGAWMTNYYEQGHFDGQLMRPHVSVVCNFTKPTPSRPSLLSFDEVRTLFHEFGHALHSMLSRCHYRSLSGTNVRWDFVELPSQIFENWTLEKEALDLFASHYKTGEMIPSDLVEKVRASSRFQAGLMSLRQLNFGLLDMAWHGKDPSAIDDVDVFEKQVTKATTLMPPIPGTNTSVAFSHIFAGGYSAGYYSYKWAEVLDADAFEFFKEKGLFNPEVAERFEEHILSRGGTEPPMELFKRFRGREPDPDALLRRDGLI